MTLVRPPQIYFDDFLEEITADQILIANQNPPNYQQHVPVNAPVYFEVLDLGVGIQIPNNVLVYMNGDLVYDGIGFQAGYAGSTLNKTTSPGSAVLDEWQFTILHSTLWTSEQLVTMRVEADSTGGYAAIREWSFYAADIIKPEVDSLEATSPRTLKITFNEAVNPATVIPANLTFSSSDPPYYIPESFTITQVDDDGAVWELKFIQELSNARQYSLFVENIEDDETPVANVIDPITIPFTSAAYPWPEGRVWSLWSWIPRRVRWIDRLTGSSPGHTEYFIQCLQEIADLLLFDIDEDQYIYDLNQAPVGAIELLLHWFYNPFNFVMTDEEKRKLAGVLSEVHQSKNAPGLKDVIFFFLGIDVEIVPLTSSSRSWRLAGSATDPSPPYGKLGISTYLRPPSGSAAYYTFKVIVPVALTDSERTKMIQIIEVMKNSHEHYIIEEPASPPADFWLLGIAGRGELGKTTLLAGP